METELEEEKGKNLKLRAQNNRDYENSSLPSSKSIKNKKITNSREKTEKKPGGQPGYQGHCQKKAELERKTMFADMLLSPIMHTDCTNAKVNGKSAYVFVCAIPSMENESERTWNKQMYSLIREMIHDRKALPPETNCSKEKIAEFKSQYDRILDQANHLLFLHNYTIPTSNYEAERLLRGYKRKQVQAVSFRSQAVSIISVNEVENEAKKAGCQLAHLTTYSFQAPLFYQKQGYVICGEINGFPD